MAANSTGDKASGIHTAKQNFLSKAPGPMGDAPQKRPLEDGDQPGAKKLASFIPGSFDSASGKQNSNVMNESMRLPDDLVGLIIGRGGENIMKMQRETGCRIQITQSVPGTQERPCTLSGTPEQIEVCKNMLNEIISRSQAGTLGDNFSLNSGGGMPGPGGPPGMGGGMGDGLEKQIEIAIPADKCGLIIGKGGETIKMLQQSLGCKMLLVQDSTENVGHSKPLRITGTQGNIDNAVNTIHQMMAQRDKQIAEQKMNSGMFGDDSQVIPVPKAAVGVVIGKGGDMISQIQNMTATRIQFKPEDAHLPDRICTVTGSKEGVEAAIGRIQQIIGNVLERDGSGRRGPGGGGNMRGPPGGGGMGGGFGQWESPNMNRGGRQMSVTTEEHLVPANKTGLVIGKGGETIKQINMQSGAHAEIIRNPPPGSDLNYKTFLIKGTPDQIKMCRQLIQDRVDDRPGGGMPGGPMGGPNQGPHQGGPPMGNFGPPPHQNNFGGMPPGGMPPQNPMQGPPQGQPGQPFQQQQPQQQPPQQPQAQQPWGNQFQQWTPPAAAATATATPPQQNGKPVADANSAAWQSYMQLYAHSQPGYQAPAAASQAAPAPAVPTPAAAPAAAAPQDYSKQWDEYLKQTGAVAAAAAAAQAATPAAAVAAQAIQAQQVAAAAPTPAAAAPAAVPAAAAAQPATAQTDYSAAWAEYYRQYYQLQGQQYAAAAAAGQPPAQS